MSEQNNTKSNPETPIPLSEKLTHQEKQKLIDLLATFDQTNDIFSLINAGLTPETLKQNPELPQKYLFQLFLTPKGNRHQVNFLNNELAEFHLPLTNLLPPSATTINIYDNNNQLIFANCQRTLSANGPSYISETGQPPFLRTGFSVEILQNSPKSPKTQLVQTIQFEQNIEAQNQDSKAQALADLQKRILLPTTEERYKELQKVASTLPLSRPTKLDSYVQNHSIPATTPLMVFRNRLIKQPISKPTQKWSPAPEDSPFIPPLLRSPNQNIENPTVKNLIQVARSELNSTNYRTPDVAYGRLACAKVVSTILFRAGIISKIYLGVTDLQNHLLRQGWTFANEPKPGYIVILGRTPTTMRNGYAMPGHKHIGIATSNSTYINNNSYLATPTETPIPKSSPRGIFYLKPPF